MRALRLWVALAAALVLCAAPGRAEPLHRELMYLPMAAASPAGLEALLVRPAAPGKYPLVLMSHGTSRNASEQKNTTPWRMYPQAVEFARRGWAAVAVLRRGYGGSGGGYVERVFCNNSPDFLASGQISARDLKAAIEALARRSDIDTTRMIAIGQSAGGFATVALTADAPPGLRAAISFAGGRGSNRNYHVCHEDSMVAAFGVFGKTSRVPMLWVYAENDHYFGPEVAEKFRVAFTQAGGIVDFIKAAPFGTDGHALFSQRGIPIWTVMVDEFLAKQGLALRATPMALDLPPLTVPPQIPENKRTAFTFYLRSGLHKAFAVSSDGHFGLMTARRTVEEATDGALKGCRKLGKDCRVAFVDDAAAP